MPRLIRMLGPIAALAVVAACGSDNSSSSSTTAAGTEARTIEVTLTPDACSPFSMVATAGPTVFHVTNEDAADVTEFYVLDGTKILGEVEGITPGKDGSLALTLDEGSFTTKCLGATKPLGTLEVAKSGTGQTANTEAQNLAVKTYLDYVAAEAALLVPATTEFANLVKAGDVEGAKAKFASARYHYETIEPIAESFGDLDPLIDAREGDVPDAEWTGYHRIEKALWEGGDISAMGPVADQLIVDVTKLKDLIPSLTGDLEPAQIANGAVELLNEVSSSKITGEEDRYSHTDLSDFAANLEGAKAAFTAVAPLLASDNATLSTTIEQNFAAVSAGLDAHKDAASVANGYVIYTDLTPEQTAALSTLVDALAEPLSKVAAQVLT